MLVAGFYLSIFFEDAPTDVLGWIFHPLLALLGIAIPLAVWSLGIYILGNTGEVVLVAGLTAGGGFAVGFTIRDLLRVDGPEDEYARWARIAGSLAGGVGALTCAMASVVALVDSQLVLSVPLVVAACALGCLGVAHLKDSDRWGETSAVGLTIASVGFGLFAWVSGLPLLGAALVSIGVVDGLKMTVDFSKDPGGRLRSWLMTLTRDPSV
ncbi:hypothetical protein I0C86_14290 [Plantactinospora sp. S1510]|uniref:DUF92 domain-containing protein n=2 Tax=Plantactinospora alkalitolerans TaxID=2789879 RepID=A0ABS0GV83_9ACTN|nr:hypothetical protein [Plantactinospora alkalitolerans]